MSEEVALWLAFMGGIIVGLIIVGLILLFQVDRWKKGNHK